MFMRNLLAAIIISFLFGGGVFWFIWYLLKRREAQLKLLSKKDRKVKDKVLFLSILVTFIVFFSSIFVALFVFKYFKNMEITRKWSTTKGRISSALVRVEIFGGETPCGQYYPDIRYGYEVDGSEYEGSKYQVLEWSTGDRNIAHKIVSKYVEGESCKVYYDPQNPSESVLNTETPQWEWYFLVFSILGYLSLPFLIRKRQSLVRKPTEQSGEA